MALGTLPSALYRPRGSAQVFSPEKLPTPSSDLLIGPQKASLPWLLDPEAPRRSSGGFVGNQTLKPWLRMKIYRSRLGWEIPQTPSTSGYPWRSQLGGWVPFSGCIGVHLRDRLGLGSLKGAPKHPSFSYLQFPKSCRALWAPGIQRCLI